MRGGGWGEEGGSPGDQWRLTDHINQSFSHWLTLSCSPLCLSVCLHIAVSRLQDFNNQAHPSFPHITWELLIIETQANAAKRVVDRACHGRRFCWWIMIISNYLLLKKIIIHIKNGAAFKGFACTIGSFFVVVFLIHRRFFAPNERFFMCHAPVSSIRTSCSISEDLLSSLHNEVNCVKCVRKVKQQKGSAELELPVL